MRPFYTPELQIRVIKMIAIISSMNDFRVMVVDGNKGFPMKGTITVIIRVLTVDDNKGLSLFETHF